MKLEEQLKTLTELGYWVEPSNPLAIQRIEALHTLSKVDKEFVRNNRAYLTNASTDLIMELVLVKMSGLELQQFAELGTRCIETVRAVSLEKLSQLLDQRE